MRSLLRSELAIRDLDEHAEYIAQDNLDAAIRFLEAAEETFRQIAEMPGMGSPQEHKHPQLVGVRRWAVMDFPKHLVFYRARDDEVEILRVVHGARDLGALFGG